MAVALPHEEPPIWDSVAIALATSRSTIVPPSCRIGSRGTREWLFPGPSGDLEFAETVERLAPTLDQTDLLRGYLRAALRGPWAANRSEVPSWTSLRQLPPPRERGPPENRWVWVSPP